MAKGLITWSMRMCTTTSIARRAPTSLRCVGSTGWDTTGREEKRKKPERQSYCSIVVSARFLSDETPRWENKGSPAQQRPRCDYFADFARYGFGYTLYGQARVFPRNAYGFPQNSFPRVSVGNRHFWRLYSRRNARPISFGCIELE